MRVAIFTLQRQIIVITKKLLFVWNYIFLFIFYKIATNSRLRTSEFVNRVTFRLNYYMISRFKLYNHVDTIFFIFVFGARDAMVGRAPEITFCGFGGTAEEVTLRMGWGATHAQYLGVNYIYYFLLSSKYNINLFSKSIIVR